MGFRAFASALVGIAAALAVGAASAATYVYTGSNFTTLSREGPTTPTDLYTTADRVTITITLASPLAANLSGVFVPTTAFIASDGVNTITRSSALFADFQFWTDSAGAIVNWRTLIREYTASSTLSFALKNIYTDNYVHPTLGLLVQDTGEDTLCGPTSTTFGCVLSGDPFYRQSGVVRGDPGVWVLQMDPAVVPLPAGAWLMLSGLAGLGAASTRRARQSARDQAQSAA